MNTLRLEAAPFRLDAGRIGWVEATFARLTGPQRLAQLFVLRRALFDRDGCKRIRDFRPGGITIHFGPDAAAEIAETDALSANCPVRPLVSADLEGSRMSLPFGTQVPNPLALAAVNDLAASADIARIMAQEGRAAGVNWSFTPVLDVNHAFRSAIVATRGFGSDLDCIEKQMLTQIGVFQQHGIAATAKHWPGEGYDERDQHLVTTINPLTVDEWERTFGRLYRAAIEAGVLSIMSAHIAFPAFVRSLNPGARIEAFKPASLSADLNIKLLREQLGFNGLVVSDATPMAGLGSWCNREAFVPQLLSAGCDVILFSDDPAADLAAIEAAVARGELAQAHIVDAVMRVLALKAALGLHLPDKEPVALRLAQFARPQNKAAAEAVTRRAPTLVKDAQGLLPLNLAKHRRVLIITAGIIEPWRPEPLAFALPDMLKAEGFEVTMRTPETVVSRQNFDLVLYLFGEETLLLRSRIFIDWRKLGGGGVGPAMQRPWHDIPTAMISFGYPYYLYDAPRVPTYINAYATMETMQRAVIDCLMGRSPWNEHSPVDAFCGLEDARF
jgi:beta-N-acetylhexosaminidase